MVRTALLHVLSALLIATAWLRLENGGHELRKVGLMIALAFLPAVSVAVGKRRWAIALGIATLLAACSEAFGIAVTEARPGGQHDFFGPVLGAFKDGFLTFYDTDLPFRPDAFPFMHDVVLVAIFAFCAAVSVLVAARKPVGAALVLVFAIGWPATLVPGTRPLTVGVLALAGVLAVLFLFRAGNRPVRGLAQGLAVTVVLLTAAAAASTSGAVAKGAFLDWQRWDFYNRPDTPVGVLYVWDSHYGGIHFPKKKTVVYRVRVPGPERGLYWRATTLDDYTGNGWQESLDLGPASERDQIEAVGLPVKSRNQKNWVRQDVTVASIRDTHLVASAQPVRWRPPSGTASADVRGSIVTLPNALHRDQRYTVWSYVPRVKPSQLAKAGVVYPSGMERYLQVIQGGARVPPFATPNRDDLMHVFFDATYQDDALVQANRQLYDVARQVVGDAPTPYAATVALETWFRRFDEGGFRYDEQPPPPPVGVPTLVDFVTRTKRGYCQHFAGSMALMLRYLGIPARVAAGFTSGSYDASKHEWKVTDHEAHTWVEVYFPGWGWLPFDPTPGRGLLNAAYSSASPVFDARDFGNPSLQGLLGSSAAVERLRTEAGRPGQQGAAGSANPSSGRGGVTVVRDKGPSIVLLALLLLLGAAGLVIGLKAVRRALRFAGKDPRALASACRRDIIGFMADQGFDLPPSATLADVGRELDRYFAIDAGSFVRSATLARFGPTNEAEQALVRARRELRRLRRDMRNQIGAMSRFRGAVSLRSLTM